MAAVKGKNFGGNRVFCVITGASRGLGRTLAVEFSRLFGEESCIILVARNMNGLEETKRAIAENSSIKNVSLVKCDLSDPEINECKKGLEKALEQCESYTSNAFDQAILVHNAGSLGDISKKASSLSDIKEIRQYLDLNLLSTITLTTFFLEKITKEIARNRLIINITSIAAIQPFVGWSLYCTGKAARDMFFKVLATEEHDSLRVLSYSPGPVDTDMTTEIIENGLPDMKEWATKARANKEFLTAEYTVSKLISLLESSKFKSGDHIDVYDF